VVYKPEADCPIFKQYLRTTLEKEIIPLIPEIIGYCLIPDTSFEKAIVLLGEGANGKSVFLNTLTALLGENNVSNSELQMLINNRFRAAELLGKLANISADIGNQRLENTERFKKLITGDRMTVEQKHKDPFEFNNYARLLFSTNELPGSRDRTYAFYRRWLIIPFTRTFKGEDADKNLTQKLVKELSGIFNLGLQGLKRLKKNNKFTEPQQVIEAKKKYKMQNDSVTAFINEKIEESKDNYIIKKHLYNEYKKWCDEQGLKPVSHRNPDFKRAFYNSIDSLDEFRTNNGNGPWAWLNIELI
jgi:putative DNA primase/helicase